MKIAAFLLAVLCIALAGFVAGKSYERTRYTKVMQYGYQISLDGTNWFPIWKTLYQRN